MSVLSWSGTADIAIVGGGWAASIFARRMSEATSAKIVVLDRGHLHQRHHLWPMCYPWLQNQARSTKPQAAVLGGSAFTGDPFVFQGTPSDQNALYALWEPHWPRESFDRALNALPTALPPSSRVWTPQGASVELAASSLGFPPLRWTADAADRGEGFQTLRELSENGQRPDPWAWKKKVGDSKLNLMEGCEVLRIEDVRTSTPAAVFRRSGDTHRLTAKTVVLCAGGVGSPTLMIKSGIGPADELRSSSIDVVQDLPVGRSTSEPCVLHFGYRSTGHYERSKSFSWRNAREIGRQIAEYVRHGTGSFSTFREVGMFAKSTSDAAQVDVCLMFLWQPWRRGWTPAFCDGFTVSAVLLRPSSRGSIAAAGYTSGTFAEESDMVVGASTLRLVDEICGDAASLHRTAMHSDVSLNPLRGQRLDRGAPSPERSGWVLGGAALGDVVDPATMEVVGCPSVRVADASVVPRGLAMSANVAHALAASRAAEALIAQWGGRTHH